MWLLGILAVLVCVRGSEVDIPLMLDDIKETRIDKLDVSMFIYLPSFKQPSDILTIYGGDNSKITVSINTTDVTISTKLEDEALITLKHKGDHRTPIQISYKRILRTINANIGGRTSSSRLVGQRYKFTAKHYTLISHPFLCIQSINYNGLSLTEKSCARFQNVDMIQNHEILHRHGTLDSTYTDCRVKVLDYPKYGSITSGGSKLGETTTDNIVVTYQNESPLGELALFALEDDFSLWVTCVDIEQAYYIMTSIDVIPVVITAETADLEFAEPNSTLTDQFLSISTNSNTDNKDISITVNDNMEFSPITMALNGNLGWVNLQPQFTYRDVQGANVIFNVKKPGRATTHTFNLTVEIAGADDVNVTLRVSYRPTIWIKNEMLHVQEGGSANLNGRLSVRYGLLKNFTFTVVQAPSHGKLVGLSGARFVSADLTNFSVNYIHDDTESGEDNFRLRVDNSEYNLQYNIIMRVNVSFVNDNEPRRQSGDVIQVVRGLDTLLTQNDLQFTDSDIFNTPNTLQYERQGISCAEVINQTNSELLYKFTQRDINDHHIIIRHLDEGKNSASCRFVFWLYDNFYTISSRLRITTIPHNLTITGSKSFSIPRNGHAKINGTILQIHSNTQLPPTHIVLSVQQAPKYGTLKMLEQYAPSFPYASLLDGAIEYLHEGGIAPRDNFTLDFSIGGNVVGNILINVTIEIDPALLHPNVTNNERIFGQPNQMIEFSADQLEVQHSYAEPQELVFSTAVAIGQQSGYFLKRNGSRSIIVTRFTQADINDGKMRYRIGQNSERFTLLINFYGKSTDIVFETSVISSPIAYQLANITVEENSETILTESILQISDLPDKFLKGLTFRLVQQPKYGKLLISQMTFTWRDLTDKKVSYMNDGSEVTQDTITLKLEHDLFKTTRRSKDLYINIIPHNDNWPEFDLPQPLVVWNDRETVVTSENVHLTDTDSNMSPDHLVISVHETSAGSFLVDDNTVNNFTQSDVIARRVTFIPAQIKGRLYSNKIKLTGWDGLHTTNTILTILRESRQLSKVSTNNPVTAIPFTISFITEKHIKTVSNDPNTEIRYQILSQPRYGMMYINDRPVVTFTQSDVTNRRLYYTSTRDSTVAELCLNISSTLIDQMHYKVTDAESTVSVRGKLRVEVSFKFVDQVIETHPVVVIEGTKALIDNKIVNTTRLDEAVSKCRIGMTYSLQPVRNPMNGQLVATEEQRGYWTYKHDHSEAKFDNFSLTVVYKQPAMSGQLANEVNVEVLISGVNDQVPQLKRGTTVLEVYAGLLYNLTGNDIMSQDIDTGPESLMITALQSTCARFYYLNPLSITSAFTQQDIDNGKVGILINASSTENMCELRLQISDGEFSSVFSFPVAILQLGVRFESFATLDLLQGTTEAVLHSGVISAVSIPSGLPILFKITENPVGGSFYKDSSVVRQFTQQDLSQYRVSYKQNDLIPHDYARLSVSVAGNPPQSVLLNITVKPNILTKNRVKISLESAVPITLQSLDASPLTRLAKPKDIIYTVVKPPQYGRLMISDKRSRRSVEGLTKFSHSDIVQEIVLYVPLKEPIKSIQEDNFTYIITCPGTAPAEGTLSIEYDSVTDSQDVPLEQLHDTPIHEGPDKVLLAVVIVISLVVCAIVFSVIIVCLRMAYKRQETRSKAASRSSSEEPRMILTKENGSYKLLVQGDEDFCLMPHSPERQIDYSSPPEYSSTVPVRVRKMVEVEALCRGNMEPINEEYFEVWRDDSGSLTTDTETNTTYNHHPHHTEPSSLDFLPNIRKPNYSC